MKEQYKMLVDLKNIGLTEVNILQEYIQVDIGRSSTTAP